MTFRFAKSLMLITCVALTACGGAGSSGSSGGGGSTGGGGGTTAGTNGLNFGASGQELSDAEGTRVTMSTASFQTGSGPDISSGSIRVNANFFNGGTSNLDGSITIFGQTVGITNGSGTLTGGQEVVLTYEPNRAGTYAAAIEASLDSRNGEAAYVLGFETNPSNMPSGSLTYRGDFQATGNLSGTTGQTEYEGTITVNVDFRGDEADFTLDGLLDGSRSVNLQGNNLDIVGNGISGNLGCSPSCSGTSTVDATFYGPNADELGGVLSIDISAGGNYDGVGTFIITP